MGGGRVVGVCVLGPCPGGVAVWGWEGGWGEWDGARPFCGTALHPNPPTPHPLPSASEGAQGQGEAQRPTYLSASFRTVPTLCVLGGSQPLLPHLCPVSVREGGMGDIQKQPCHECPAGELGFVRNQRCPMCHPVVSAAVAIKTR